MLYEMKIHQLICLPMIAFSLMAQAETLKFGLNAGYPPFESKNDQNEIVGFDVDLAKSICDDLKVTCEFVDQSFDSLLPNLKFKRFDAIISSMDITDERKKIVSFSEPYYQNGALFIAQKGKFTTIDSLKGKNIGVLNGSTHQKYMSNVFKDANIKAYPQYAAAVVDLTNGRIDAVFGDDTTALEYLKKDAKLELIEKVVDDQVYFGTGLGIAVRLDDQATLDKINKSLANIKANGTYQKIYEVWFKDRKM